MKVTRGNVEKYLSDEELATLIEIPLCPCDEHCGKCAERRKVATAASDKGYAAGQKDLARECWDWWSGERDCFNDDQFIRFEKWLRERGVM